MDKLSKEAFKEDIIEKLQSDFNVTTKNASDKQVYRALAAVIVDFLKNKRNNFINDTNSKGLKQVYYLSMEFLMGRSLKTSLYNLEIADMVEEALRDLDISLEKIYEYEPDAGLGNGGLGRLAACYLDGLATEGYTAVGYSICYEYGIFKQKIENGWQTELPDNWLPGGDCWLVPNPDNAIEVHFDGELNEYWDQQYHQISYVNYSTVYAIPYDMYVPGYDSDGVSMLRLWVSKAPSFDMAMFNQGDYAKALGQNNVAQAISKVLYPNDNHREGKSLRLRQQYFLCSASIGDIVNRHMLVYGTLDNLHEKVAIHINDTHPTLAIPELIRVLLDDCGYSWSKAWHIVSNTFAYTNHTVMAEALEKWDVMLIKQILPRIYSIITEINTRYCAALEARSSGDMDISKMAIIQGNQIHMANLCIDASHSVNGVSKLHSEIIKHEVFKNQFIDSPHKFKNVTNGIAYRRWLLQSNPGLTEFLKQCIGPKFLKDASELRKLAVFENNESVLSKLKDIKKENKEAFSKYVKNTTGVILNTESIFDVQVKRLHEYKRQHLSAMNIVSEFLYLLDNPNADYVPKTYIFAAKAAPGYYLAKQIIKLIWAISEEIKKYPHVASKLSVFFLEDYKVTLSEILMPASEVSEQISLAGTEASGTGNMKLMLNGALTIGTMDGANVEIFEQVGKDNIFIFGMDKNQVIERKRDYKSEEYYKNNRTIKNVIDRLYSGINGCTFDDIANSVRFTDPYMVLADFDSYQATQNYVSQCYKDQNKWNKMSLNNIAGAGLFSADRAVTDYARNIWHLEKK